MPKILFIKSAAGAGAAARAAAGAAAALFFLKCSANFLPEASAPYKGRRDRRDFFDDVRDMRRWDRGRRGMGVLEEDGRKKIPSRCRIVS